jgi:phenylalanyl-tRNA synthetase beta chain
MASAGFHEAFSYAMIGSLEDAPFVAAEAPAPLILANPIAETLSQLRRSLLPGLLRSTDLNERRGNPDVRLFEVGKVFLAPAATGFPEEPLRVGFAWSGAAEPRHWSRPPREVALWDAAGLVESLMTVVRSGATYGRRRAGIAGFHPGRSIEWVTADGKAVAWCGALHPDLKDRLDLAGTPYLAEIEIGHLLAPGARATAYEPLSRFPCVLRDLALVLAEGATFGSVHAVLSGVDTPVPVRFDVIDRYEGDPLPRGAVSLTVRALLEPRERTLTEAEIEGFRRRLIAALDSLPGVTLRA